MRPASLRTARMARGYIAEALMYRRVSVADILVVEALLFLATGVGIGEPAHR